MGSAHKLTFAALFVAAAIGYLAYAGAASSWQYYMSVDETVADAARLSGKRLRVSGRVAVGTLKISERRREAEFDVAGAVHTLHVSCHCPLPDNLAEDMDVVVEGALDGSVVRCHKVITRCASKYEPKEAVAARDESPGGPARR